MVVVALGLLLATTTEGTTSTGTTNATQPAPLKTTQFLNTFRLTKRSNTRLGLCSTFDVQNTAMLYAGACSRTRPGTTAAMTSYISMTPSILFAIPKGEVVSSTEASYLAAGDPPLGSTLAMVPNSAYGTANALMAGSSMYIRIDAKADFHGMSQHSTSSNPQLLTLSQANFILPYDQPSITSSTNTFFGDAVTGQSLGNPFSACIVAPTNGTCETTRTYTPGSLKYSLFARYSGALWKSTASEGVAGCLRHTVSLVGYSAYFNGDPTMDISKLGTKNVRSITFVPTVTRPGKRAARNPSFQLTLPTEVLTGPIETSGSVPNTKVDLGGKTLLPTTVGAMHIKASLASPGVLNLDYVLLMSDIPCLAENDTNANCFFLYDPVVAPTPTVPNPVVINTCPGCTLSTSLMLKSSMSLSLGQTWQTFTTPAAAFPGKRFRAQSITVCLGVEYMGRVAMTLIHASVQIFTTANAMGSKGLPLGVATYAYGSATPAVPLGSCGYITFSLTTKVELLPSTVYAVGIECSAIRIYQCYIGSARPNPYGGGRLFIQGASPSPTVGGIVSVALL